MGEHMTQIPKKWFDFTLWYSISHDLLHISNHMVWRMVMYQEKN